MVTPLDLRLAVRLLGRRPTFTVTAALSLAVGIASSAAIFGLADALLFRPRVGVVAPERLVDIGRTVRGEGFDNFGYPLFRTMRDQSTLLTAMAAHRRNADPMSLGNAQSSERVFAMLVSGNYFDVVGTRPAAGRFFRPEEDQSAGTHPVVVLTHQYWTRRFDRRPDILGQTIRLNNLAYTVIGVSEPGFSGTTFLGTDLFVPMAMDAHVRASDQSLLESHDAVWLTALGRLAPGVSVPQARDELNGIMRADMEARGDPRRERWGIAVAPSARVPAPFAGPVLGFVSVLGVLTGVVLLIACSNVAAMLLARALERRREVATRLAVGATRGRLVRQLLVEGMVLALIAGLLSVPLVYSLVGLLVSFQPSLPIPLALELRVDFRVLTFVFVLGALTTTVFAVMPAFHATRFQIAPALHGANATVDLRRAWFRHGLVVGQVAMALLLLVAAGLFLRSLQEAADIDAGFDPRGVDLLQIDTRIAGYRTDGDGVRVVDALGERFRALPGVRAVGASRMVPLMSGTLGLGALRAPGYIGADGREEIDADWDVVSPGYFSALGVALVRGRAFTELDREGATRVAIVNGMLAARVWPGRDPIGQTLLHQSGRAAGDVRALTVVGVAANARHRSLSEAPRSFIYVPLAQQFLSEVNFYVRREGEGSRLNDLRAAVVAFDPNLPILHVQALEDYTAIALLPQRLAAWIAASVGTIGLLLAALGLYGLSAFSVAQRAREIAVRMALGASRDAVMAMVLRQSARLALAGTALGLALATGFGLLLRSLLVGVEPVDPIALTIATIVLGSVLVGAAWVPARRAANLDPMRTLRSE